MPDSFSAPMRSTPPVGSPARYTDPKQIDAILKSSDPEAVAESGRSYQKFAAAYEKIAGELLKMRSDLHDAWSGEAAAAAAQSQLREVWSAATTVHQTAGTFGVTIERHGSEHLTWYKYNKPPSKNLQEAQSWMTGANERVTQAWGSLPQDLSTSLPPGGGELWHGPAVTDPANGTGGSTEAAPVGLDGGSPHYSSAAEADDSSLSGAGGTGTELAGFSPPDLIGGASGSVPFPGAAGGSDSTVAGPIPLPSSRADLPGAGLMSPQGILGAQSGRPGVVGSGFEARPSGVAGEVTPGAEGRPVLGGTVAGAGLEEEKERTRRNWLAEDEDVWTEGITAVPQLIEGEAPAVDAEEPADSPIEIDLSADGDAITAILAELEEENPAEDAQDLSVQISELQAQLARLERQRDAERGRPAAGDVENLAPDWLGGEDG